MRKRSGGKKRGPVSEHFKIAYRQSFLNEFVSEEPSLSEGSPLPQDLVQQLGDIQLRISRLEGERVFTSGELPRALDSYIEEHPEMLSVNAEMKELIERGKIRVIT